VRRELTPYRPLSPAEMLRGSFPSNFFENLFNSSFMAGFNSGMRSDIRETQQDFTLEVEMPGFAKENINVECSEGHLTITASNTQETDESKGSYVRQERQYGTISRSYRIDGIDENRITAQYQDGILKLTLPKSNEVTNKVKRIDIH
jgi:HSP20 family protein